MQNSTRGFTVFFAVLVGSLALAIGLSVYELLLRELELSQVARESQYAIYAADAGAECALYWDAHYNGTNSAFATSSDTANVASGVTCTTLSTGSVSHDIAANGRPTTLNGNLSDPPTLSTASGNNVPQTGWAAWREDMTATNATTTFLILLGNAITSPCAKVIVGKNTAGGGVPHKTTVISRGYNTCSASAAVRVERAFQVSY